jgi:hypothetical protein
MPRISTAAAAWQRAAECEALAARAPAEESRRMYIALRDAWIDLANELQIVESAKGASPGPNTDNHS